MQAILSVIGFVLIGAGVVVGLVSFFSPGQVVLGLNLSVAATLLVGGCIVTGLSALIGAVRDLAEALSRPIVPLSVEQFESADTAFAATAAVGAAEVAHTKGESVAQSATTAAADAIEMPVSDGVADAAVAEQFMDTATTDDAPDAPVAVDPAQAHAANEVSETPFPLDPVVATVGDQTAEPEMPENSPQELAGYDTAEATHPAPADPDEDILAAAPHEDEDAVDGQGEDTDDGQADADPVDEDVSAGPCAPDREETEEPVSVATNAATDISEAVDDVSATAEDAPDQIADEVDDATGTKVDLQVVEDTDADAGAETSDKKLEPEPESPGEEQSAVEQVTEPDAEPEEAPQEALYVMEETTVRERPARLLSDGTVEAETDAGWMRFENMEHLNEYLDAMSA